MPGFDFSNHDRNAALHARGVPLPKATSTGTTIVGCLFDGGVVVCFEFSSPNLIIPSALATHLEMYLGHQADTVNR